MLASTIVAVEQATPCLFHYDIELGSRFEVRRLALTAAGDRSAALTLSSNGFGQWFERGIPQPALTGALDVGLWLTPVPHGLVLSRLQLGFGQTMRLPLVWIDDLDLTPRILYWEYTYQRRDQDGLHFTLAHEAGVGQRPREPRPLSLDPDGFIREAGDYRRLP